jgi:hypothetical protein
MSTGFSKNMFDPDCEKIRLPLFGGDGLRGVTLSILPEEASYAFL